MATINRNLVATENKSARLIDARGPRFGAVITTAVLAVALVTHSAFVIGLQLLVFAIGAFLGPQKTPYAFLYKRFVKPRLSGEVPTEDVRPPQFAQKIGFLFAVAALSGAILSAPVLFAVATSFALAAAFLNAAFNFCLGCELYLLIARATNR
ncbi:MAG: DUF4395 domain-containing protein [Actinomycetes bacterium]